MRLKSNIIPMLNNPRNRSLLALALGFSDQWVFHSLKKNKVNGPLTTVTAMKVIREVLGLDDQEILEEQLIGAESEK